MKRNLDTNTKDTKNVFYQRPLGKEDVTHRNARTKYISFRESDHSYKVDFHGLLKDKLIPSVPQYSKIPFVSVTTLLAQFFPKFETDTIITLIQQNPYSGYGNKTKDQIENLWNENKTRASSLGTKMHAFFEESLKPFLLKHTLMDLLSVEKNLIPCIHLDPYDSIYDSQLSDDDPMKDYDTKENALFLKCMFQALQTWITSDENGKKSRKIFEEYVLYAVEWRIFDEDVNLCGTIDCVLVNPKNFGEVVLIDHKRSKNLITDKPRGECTHPVTKGLSNSKSSKHAVQLNLYKKIFETKYNAVVTGMFVFNIDPIVKMGFIIEIPSLPNVMTKVYDYLVHNQKEEISPT